MHKYEISNWHAHLRRGSNLGTNLRALHELHHMYLAFTPTYKPSYIDMC